MNGAGLTLNIQSGISRELPEFESIHGFVLGVAVLDLQCVNHAVYRDLVFVTWEDLHSVLDPLGPFHVQMSEFKTEHGFLCLGDCLVLQSLFDFHGYDTKHQG